MIRPFIAALAIAFATTAFGAGLADYSTEELMEEVGRRIDALQGGGGSGGSGSFEISFACNNHVLSVSMISEGANKTVEYGNSTGGKCNSLRTFLASKFAGTFNAFKVVDVCENHVQHKLRITAADITEISQAGHGTQASCYTAIGVGAQ